MRPPIRKEKEDALRPDPYLDWEFRTRSGLPASRRQQSGDAPDDLWCSLYVRVKLGPDSDRLANLRALDEAVRIGRLPEDDTAQPGPSIRMTDNERALLKEVIRTKNGNEIQSDEHKVLRQFFVYRLESLIYREGDYAPTELYEVTMAGPPIRDLAFEGGDDDEIHPNELTQLPGIDKGAVAIGVIDDGIAFAHARFRSDPLTSRVMAIWLQDVERAENRPPSKKGRGDPGMAFGRFLDNKQINDLLARHNTEPDTEIYRELGLIDFGKNTYNPLALRATHGTHVLDVAAGYDPVNQPDMHRPILAVQLPSIATLDTSGVTMGSYVLQAVRQIMLWADKLGTNIPLVINFSYGLSAGPKDGKHPIEVALNELISYRNRRASTCLVLPAGNTYRARTTARMELAKGQSDTLDWVILPDDPTPNFLEIWLDPKPEGTSATERTSPIEVTLTPPDGLPSKVARPARGELSTLKRDEKSIAAAYYDVSKGKRGRIFIAVNQTATRNGRVDCAPAGRWRLRLENKSDHEVTAHLYIQRDSTPFGYRRPGRQSFFDHAKAHCRDEATGNYDGLEEKCPITRKETLSALATLAPGGDSSIFVVGAAEASEGFVPAVYSSSGPARARKGPDCAAVAEEGGAHWGVLAAGTSSGSIVKMGGTSVAAPQLVRWIASCFEKHPVACELPAMAAINAPDQEAFPAGDSTRTGLFVVQRKPNRHVPWRRYPVKSGYDPNDEITY